MNSLGKAALYYLIAFGLALLIALFGERLGDISRLISMLTPVTAVLLMMLVLTRDGYSKQGWKILGLHQLGLRGWPLAILGPLLILSFAYILVWLIGVGRPDLANYHAGLNLLLDPFIDTFFALAEEIGWRGYFLPHLLKLGRTRALLLSGFLHGVYHLPLMLLTTSYHADGNRLIVVSLFLLTITLAGVIYGYLRLYTGSVWPVALAHGILNTMWYQFSVLTVAVTSPVQLEYLAGESGVFSLIGAAILAGWLLYQLNRQERVTAEQRVLAASQ